MIYWLLLVIPWRDAELSSNFWVFDDIRLEFKFIFDTLKSKYKIGLKSLQIIVLLQTNNTDHVEKANITCPTIENYCFWKKNSWFFG